MMARSGARADEALAHYERAIELFEVDGSTHRAARVSARLAEILWVDKGRIEQGIESMERAFEVLSSEEPDEDLAAIAAQLGRFLFFHGESELALQRVEVALGLAEALGAAEILSEALNTKAIVLAGRGRRHEALALLPYALELALEYEKPSAALRAYFNLADTLGQADRYDEAAKAVRDGLALARRVGDRRWEWSLLGQLFPVFSLGAWDELETMITQLPEDRWSEIRQAWPAILQFGATVRSFRGRADDAEALLRRCADMESSADLQERQSFHVGRAILLLMAKDAAQALEAAELALAAREAMGMAQENTKQAFVTAAEAALELEDLDKVEELLTMVEALPPGHSSQFLQAQASRFRAHLAGRRGEAHEADRLFKRATGLFRELALVFYLALTQLEHAEWLSSQGRTADAEPLVAEAREIFERLGATPWLERAGSRVEVLAG
jgi:tetratricopeptide (TPR) repeat protein